MNVTLLAICGGLLLTSIGGKVAYAQEASPSSTPTLRAAAGDRVLVGTAIMLSALDDPRQAALIAGQFNCVTGENEFKPLSVHPEPDTFTFEAADKIVSFAKAHDMKVVGHTLCWHNQSPAWLFQDADKKPLSRETALANLKAHIDAVAGHFKGQVIGWDVVNEAISDSPGEYLRDTPARRAIGDDYIVKAFEFAHAADPGAELYYNDYSNENPEKREKTIRLIRELKAAGCRVDGVGIQGHFMTKYASTTAKILDQAIGAFAAEGVKVMITELDVDVLPRKSSGAEVTATEKEGLDPYKSGLTEEASEALTSFYADIFHVLAKHPKTVTRVTFWGTHDGSSWLNNWPVRGRTNHPLLFDRQLQPKPAFNVVLQTLQGWGS